MSHILVTGANGFIGSQLVNQLAKSTQCRVYVLDLFPRQYDPLPPGVRYIQGNLSDKNLIRQTLVDAGIDVVYHLAWSTIHETSLKNPIADIELNLIPSVQLIESCIEANVKQFIYISSGGTVYGIPKTLPIPEDHPTHPVNAYGITKLAVEKYVQMQAYLNGMNYVIFRPSVPYGPYQNPHRRQGVISVFIYHALRREPVTIWGDGEILRDYFYIDDLTRALVSALDLSASMNHVINLGGKEMVSLNQVAAKIEDCLGVKLQINYEPARKFDIPQLKLDIHTAEKTLNWHPEVPLSEGIARTARWIKSIVD